ncbi:dipeptide ABC transporter ATP-binding protein [Celeribacter indicus]|uniref:Peptide ABC transporter ATP-binding protein n=1 Tax=Celeribacter indicus TaxID=1208324 RepID=A0A0B5E6V9_9RHOB|nr:ABC transporter ATP-binding protein [Celeribacter indicus]AJE48746.1 peptide ABC transporter ATP-binding protein [Celeribacter indicus]SDX11568.1 peptide/nickel transport system ATP-binding protein [Celeribacter indicus]
MTIPLLELRGLTVRHAGAAAPAVTALDLKLARGEALALVGESGCGKSTTAMAVMGLLPPNTTVTGEARLAGEDLLSMPSACRRALQGNQMGIVFQEPMTSLNPIYPIGWQIAEVLREHRPARRAAIRERVLELLDLVRLDDPARRIAQYPHQLSGGQRQRAMIAMAIACSPDILIADEPTTALDATIQHEILELLGSLRREMAMGLLLISHDLSVVSRHTDRAIVMHHGEKLEELSSTDLRSHGHHPYTRGLIRASIRLEDRRHYATERLAEIDIQEKPDGTYAYDVRHAPPPMPTMPLTAAPLLSVEDLIVTHKSAPAPAVDGVSLTIAPGETLGLVGESGSGKSTLSRALLRLLPAQAGRILFDGQDITHLSERRMRPVRRNIQMVFQDPFASLNPRHSIGDTLDAVLRLHGVVDRRERRAKMAEALDQVRLPVDSLTRWPHEFSGGQRQRIAIARALILRPRLLVCDEPVSALDVSVQAKVLNLLADLKQEFRLSLLFISHDLAVVDYFSDRTLVMRHGKIIDSLQRLTAGDAGMDDYTRALMSVA